MGDSPALCIEDLLKLEPFRMLPRERLEWVCHQVQPIDLVRGEILMREGDPARGLFILVAGQCNITRRSDGVEIPLGRHEAPSFFGEMPVLADEPALVSMRALSDCHLYKLAGEDFLSLLHNCRDFERTIFRILYTRLRGLESFIRNREKMASLGTLAAGLAHELNNPAAAVVRALRDVTPALLELQRMNLLYGQRNVDEAHTQQWLKVRDDGYDAILNDHLDPMTISDREEELLNWLEDYGVENAWKLAEPLAAGNVSPEALDQLMERWRNDPTELRDMGLRWLAVSFDVMRMIKGGLRGSERIAKLVKAMKSYSYLDQGAQQELDVHQGLEDTLSLLEHKLKYGIKVQRAYDRTLPKICAFGTELNQVWTNLIDNAIDAMNGSGTLKISTTQDDKLIRIEISDSGSGIPREIQSRIFEPFYTTKPIGKGSGLGLDLVRRIVENRHQGTVTVESRPGRTCFIVCLPIPCPRNVELRSQDALSGEDGMMESVIMESAMPENVAIGFDKIV